MVVTVFVFCSVYSFFYLYVSGSLLGSQLASTVFTWGTVAVLPFYTLMVLAPKSELVCLLLYWENLWSMITIHLQFLGSLTTSFLKYIIHKIYLHGRTCILPPCPTFKLNLNLSVVVKLSVWWILIFFLIPFIGLWILWFWNSCLYDWFIFLKCKNADQKVYGKYSTICSARRAICIFIVHFMDPWDGSIDFCK